MSRPPRFRLACGLALGIGLGSACSGDGAEGNAAETSGSGGNAAGSDPYRPVTALDRGPGMPIGQGAAGPGNEADDDLGLADGAGGATAGLDIPTFEDIESEIAIPCGGCVELNVVVNDVNQRNDFELAVDTADITRIVWTVAIVFNSDQLFVRSLINGIPGPYRQLHANDYPIGAPFELEQIYFGAPATRIGMAMGSSGAWTGNQPMRLFIDGVTMELEDGSTRSHSFDAGLEGMAAISEERDAHVVYHPLE